MQPHFCFSYKENREWFDLHDEILNHRKSKHVGFIFLQGAGLASSQYIGSVAQIQRSSDRPIFAAVPAFLGAIPTKWSVRSAIRNMVKEMKKQGMDEDAKIIVAGHSLGGTFLQVETIRNNSL